MKKGISLLIVLTALLLSCSKAGLQEGKTANKVLMLKVDYTTNKFEGGKEFTFTKPASTFTITNQYHAPADFGSIKLTYQELNETLFDGTIIWMGLGKMNFPTDLLPPDKFDAVITDDFVSPANGFQNVFNPDDETYDYTRVWMSVQYLVKARDYLKTNPNQTVKIFLYTPSVGVGNPADWYWIIYMKN